MGKQPTDDEVQRWAVEEVLGAGWNQDTSPDLFGNWTLLPLLNQWVARYTERLSLWTSSSGFCVCLLTYKVCGIR